MCRLITGLLLMAGCVWAQGQAVRTPSTHTAQSLNRTVSKPVRVNYYLYLPRGYSTAGEYRWPVLLFLHGAGERGDDLERVKVHGPPKVIDTIEGFDAIIISPQCPADQTWDNETLLTLLSEVSYRYKGDPKRTYLTGLSMGGYAAWSLATEHPERFAAVVPVCGGGNTLPVKLASGAKKKALMDLPIWAFHGAKDTVVDPGESERMVKALKEIGAKNVKLTIYPEAGHDAWTETYNNPELYKWLLRQNLEPKRDR